ncbi:MAG: STAS domain-containing protein [Candidatus Hinthialibacter antarcticus]|nr:STAS domain-containing protein [Candidatus Hinthialibacter antarcticus]
MPIHIRLESGIAIIQPEGRIDANQVSEFASSMKRSIRDVKGHVLVNFSKTEYISSSCLRELIVAHKQATEQSKHLSICSPSPELQELFQVVHLQQSFEIYPSEFEALDALMD